MCRAGGVDVAEYKRCMIDANYIEVLTVYGFIILVLFGIFLMFCIIFLPIFVFQIRNTLKKIHAQIDQLIEITNKNST